MSRGPTQRRPQPRRRRPGAARPGAPLPARRDGQARAHPVEALEPRVLLAGASGPRVIASSVVPDQVVPLVSDRSQAITFQFDEPINPGSLGLDSFTLTYPPSTRLSALTPTS